MASIQPYKGNRWRAQVFRRGARKSATFDTEEAARRWAAKMASQIDATDTLALSIVPKKVLDAVASIPHSLVEVLDAAIPVENMVGIYFLIQGGEVVYVGQSGANILGRVAKHMRDDKGKVFDSFAYIRCDLDEIDALEEKYILAFMPKWNFSIGSSRPRARSARLQERAPSPIR